jgi:DNA-binding transcriptional ArsR family regulator
MVQSKKDLFNDGLQVGADLFRALGHPARMAILQLLAEKGECTAGEVTDEIPLGRSTVNQHLDALLEMKLIKKQSHGAHTIYQLNSKKVKEFSGISKKFWKKLKSAGLSE